MSTVIRSFAVVFLSAALFGCAQPGKRIHAEYDRRVSGIRVVGIVVPEISYYDVSFGGTREKNDESSQQANENVVAAIKAELVQRGFEAREIAREGELKQSLDEIVGLFDTIAWSYRSHVLAASPGDVFPHKAAFFDYSVGPIDDVLDAHHVDALILVDGGGRGNSFFVTGGTVLLVALADRTGALLWFEPYAKPSGFIQRDIRDPEKVRKIVEEIFKTMPEAGK